MAQSAEQQKWIGELLVLKKQATKLVNATVGTIYEMRFRRVLSAVNDAIADTRED